MTKLIADDVQWVVNNYAELGVKIGDQFFWLYKGHSLVYKSSKSGGEIMLWRPVGKREFGECVHPIKFAQPGTRLPEHYDEKLYVGLGMHGEGEEVPWQPMPLADAE